jgi:hypothetical protein
MKRQKAEEDAVEESNRLGDRSRPYSHAATQSNAKPTEFEMEAYQMRRVHADDPMASML